MNFELEELKYNIPRVYLGRRVFASEMWMLYTYAYSYTYMHVQQSMCDSKYQAVAVRTVIYA